MHGVMVLYAWSFLYARCISLMAFLGVIYMQGRFMFVCMVKTSLDACLYAR